MMQVDEKEVTVYTEQEWKTGISWGELMNRTNDLPAVVVAGPLVYNDNRVIHVHIPEAHPAPQPTESLWDAISERRWSAAPSPCTPSRTGFTTIGRRIERRSPEAVKVLQTIPANGRWEDLTQRQKRAYQQFSLASMPPPREGDAGA